MSTVLRRSTVLSAVAILIALGLAFGVLYSPLGNQTSSATRTQTTTTPTNATSISPSTTISQSTAAATTTINCNGGALCGPYVVFAITALTSAPSLGGNHSLVAGILECTHTNLPPASSIEFQWISPNPINGGYPVGTQVNYTHIATVTPSWQKNQQGKYDYSFAFSLAESSFQVISGKNYTIGIVANWNAGPLAASNPADGETITIPAQ